MQELSIKIHKDDLHNFFNLYDKLGPKQKIIWGRIVWYVKKYPNAHPGQDKLSKGIPCSRKHVNRTLALFQRYGWVALISRGAKRCKELSIPYHLIMVDLSKREYFMRLEVTSKVTHSYSRYKRISSRDELLEIPQNIKKMDIPLEAKLKLSMISEHSFQESLHQCKRKALTGWKPDNEISYFVETALNIEQKKDKKLPWIKYYHTMKVMRGMI